ncbi:MAG: hypothetical protein ACRCVG_05410 [Methanobacteriaceae archaeon]
MENQIEELRTKALAAKPNIKKGGFITVIGDEEQKFRVGIGQKSVKLEIYIKYDQIIEAVESGKVNGLEMALKEMIESADDEEVIEYDE